MEKLETASTLSVTYANLPVKHCAHAFGARLLSTLAQKFYSYPWKGKLAIRKFLIKRFLLCLLVDKCTQVHERC